MTFTAADVFLSSLAESGVGPLAKAAKRGEGSHGGHIIGHTRSGKPIYGATHAGYRRIDHLGDDEALGKPTLKLYPKFSLEDHDDAKRLHQELGSKHFAAEKAAEKDGDFIIAQAHNTIANGHVIADLGHSRANRILRGRGEDYPARAYHAADGGAEIHDAGHPAYQGMSNAMAASRKSGTIAYQNSRAHNVGQIETHLGHYDLADHKAAIQHHSDLATAHRDAASKRSPTGTVAQRHNEQADFHSSVALAHSDAAEKAHGDPGSMKWLVGKSDPPGAEDGDDRLLKAFKRGEGSHGGHVVGHTKSGKPIYGLKSTQQAVASGKKGALHAALSFNAPKVEAHYPGASAARHQALADLHDSHKELVRDKQETVGDRHSAQMLQRVWDHHNTLASTHSHIAAQKSGRDKVSKAAKRGEGSHGGHVVGHTSSGKPIYRSATGHPGYTKQDWLDAADKHFSLARKALSAGQRKKNGSHSQMQDAMSWGHHGDAGRWFQAQAYREPATHEGNG